MEENLRPVFVECPKCGWVHFAVSEAYVKDWEEDWARLWLTYTLEQRELFGCADAPPTREGYLKCFRCGSRDTSSFFPTAKDLNGNTIQPVLWAPPTSRRIKVDP